MADLVTFGETMLRYTVPAGQRLEASDEHAVHVGGAESNVAVAAARHGVDAAWLSKLVDSPLGRKVERAVRVEGVETDVVWTDEGRQGVYYVEPADPPRDSEVVYDRAEASVTTATAAELPTDQLASASLFYTSGITPALSSTLEATTMDLLQTADEHGVTTVFDVNYRAKLWKPERCRRVLDDLLESVNVLVVGIDDAETVFERTGSPEEVARWFEERYDHEIVVVTRGEEGAVALTEGTVFEQDVFETTTRDPIGTGDAFVGGFLARWQATEDIASALEYGAATAALKRTIDGDMALVSPDEVRAVLDGSAAEISR